MNRRNSKQRQDERCGKEENPAASLANCAKPVVLARHLHVPFLAKGGLNSNEALIRGQLGIKCGRSWSFNCMRFIQATSRQPGIICLKTPLQMRDFDETIQERLVIRPTLVTVVFMFPCGNSKTAALMRAEMGHAS